jgi:hypothetical protein
VSTLELIAPTREAARAGTLLTADAVLRDDWLIHRWAPGEPPVALPAGCWSLGLCRAAENSVASPWSAPRWTFVGARPRIEASEFRL